ncbi:MAG TPA: hypothetical protein VFV49_16390 [Thermoanaerobaculia bacterium]|nr:hypothetical protein [Thermoanaerobaculia bacterium]
MFNPADRLNWANIGLMVVSCAAAVVAPFHVFLFAYAVLGPLHYLTEMSWLHDREFFTPSRFNRRGWLFLVMVSAAVMAFGYVSTDLLKRPVSPTIEIGLFLLVFIAASVAAFVRHPVNAIALAGAAIIGLLMFSAYPAYGILAYLLMTIIHVFVFTGLFILSGAMKTRSRTGYGSLAVFLACAVATLLVSVPSVAPAGEVRAIYAAFEQLNLLLLGFMKAPADSVYETSGAGVMRFIAFAYLYHYLNWFSKTSIIKWHEVSRLRGAGIVTAWAAGVGLYLYSYQLGFAVFYVLSVMHVMLEFPLNHQSFVNVLRVFSPAAARPAATATLKPARG